jgi:rhodanese-related sulfurtransferase
MSTIWIKACKQSVKILVIASFIGLLTNLLRPDGLILDTKWPITVQSSSMPGEIRHISLEKAEHLFFSNTALFLDARPAEAYRKGHIQGALSLPFHNLEEQYIAISQKLPPNKLIITYCDGENCALSHDLARFLIRDGYNKVAVLGNGWTSWQNHHLPISVAKDHHFSNDHPQK